MVILYSIIKLILIINNNLIKREFCVLINGCRISIVYTVCVYMYVGNGKLRVNNVNAAIISRRIITSKVYKSIYI